MNLSYLFSPSKWARSCLKPTNQRKAIRQRPSFRPRLEVLEDRTLLAATFNVTLGTDNNPNGGGQQDQNQANSGDLRWCLNQANLGAGNTILFPDQFKTPIDLQAVLPDISQSMSIKSAPGIENTIERSKTAATNFRIFTIDPGMTVDFGDFIIQNGNLAGNPQNDLGAGIYNQGTLTLSLTTVQQNTTDGNGGGIYNTGNLTLLWATINNNQALNGKGGGLYNRGTVTTVGLPLLGHVASELSTNQAADGAAIYNDNGGNMILNRLQIINNIAQTDGGGIYNNSTANLTIQNSTFTNNKLYFP